MVNKPVNLEKKQENQNQTSGVHGAKLLLAYTKERGFGHTQFCDRVREFFRESLNHTFRLSLRNYIAEIESKKGIDINLENPEGRKKIWRLIATGVHPTAHGKKLDPEMRKRVDSVAKGWSDGTFDAALPTMFNYFTPANGLSNELLAKVMNYDATTNMINAIARTITYIQVLPPIKKLDEPVPIKLKECRELLVYKHPHYARTAKRLRNGTQITSRFHMGLGTAR